VIQVGSGYDKSPQSVISITASSHALCDSVFASTAYGGSLKCKNGPAGAGTDYPRKVRKLSWQHPLQYNELRKNRSQ
jgi:hypothetical protein